MARATRWVELAMIYRVCKQFTVESGHMLSKHRERCRYPHGHSRRIEVVLARGQLDENDMVCDFQVIKLALAELLDQLDHGLCINSDDPMREALAEQHPRLVVFKGADPTTEIIARRIFDHLAGCIAEGRTYRSSAGVEYRFPPGLLLERVRVWETPTSWAECGVSPPAAGQADSVGGR